MTSLPRRSLLVGVLALAACGRGADVTRRGPNTSGLYPGETPAIRKMILKYAEVYEVPAPLIHRIVQRESDYNPAARHGPYYGLMQILPQTAHTMGHRGPAAELYDPDVNLRFGVKYLRGAWLLSHGSYDQAEHWYASGYYYEAKRRGMLVETGLRSA